MSINHSFLPSSFPQSRRRNVVVLDINFASLCSLANSTIFNLHNYLFGSVLYILYVSTCCHVIPYKLPPFIALSSGTHTIRGAYFPKIISFALIGLLQLNLCFYYNIKDMIFLYTNLKNLFFNGKYTPLSQHDYGKGYV